MAEAKQRGEASQLAHRQDQLETDLERLQRGDIIFTTLRRGDTVRAGVVIHVGEAEEDTGEVRRILAVETWPSGWDSTWQPCDTCGTMPLGRRMMAATLWVTDAEITEVLPRTATRLWGKAAAILTVVLTPGRSPAGSRLQLVKWAHELTELAEKGE